MNAEAHAAVLCGAFVQQCLGITVRFPCQHRVNQREGERGRETGREAGCASVRESCRRRSGLLYHIRLLLTLRAGGARRNLSSVFPLCGHTDNNRTTAGKMVFLLHMVSLYTLSVFCGASAATHCEYST